jgi:hypothetical protein
MSGKLERTLYNLLGMRAFLIFWPVELLVIPPWYYNWVGTLFALFSGQETQSQKRISTDSAWMPCLCLVEKDRNFDVLFLLTLCVVGWSSSSVKLGEQLSGRNRCGMMRKHYMFIAFSSSGDCPRALCSRRSCHQLSIFRNSLFCSTRNRRIEE